MTNNYTAPYICKLSFKHEWVLLPDTMIGDKNTFTCRVRCRRCKEEKEI